RPAPHPRPRARAGSARPHPRGAARAPLRHRDRRRAGRRGGAGRAHREDPSREARRQGGAMSPLGPVLAQPVREDFVAAAVRPEVEACIRGLLADHLGVDTEQITPEVSLVDDLAADSLDLVEIALSIEGNLRVILPHQFLDRVRTCGDLVDETLAVVRRGRRGTGSHADARSGGGRMCNRSHRKRRRIVAGGLTLLLLLGRSAQAFAESAAERRLRVLEETLRKTQEEVQELHRQLDQQKASTQETQKKVDEAAISAKTASADAKKAVSLPDWLSRTTV